MGDRRRGRAQLQTKEASEWWETLTATERAWAQAYQRDGSRLAELQR